MNTFLLRYELTNATNKRQLGINDAIKSQFPESIHLSQTLIMFETSLTEERLTNAIAKLFLPYDKYIVFRATVLCWSGLTPEQAIWASQHQT